MSGLLNASELAGYTKVWRYIKLREVRIRFRYRTWAGPGSTAQTVHPQPLFYWATAARGPASDPSMNIVATDIDTTDQRGIRCMKIRGGQTWAIRFRPLIKKTDIEWMQLNDGSIPAEAGRRRQLRWARPGWYDMYDTLWSPGTVTPYTSNSSILRNVMHFCGSWAIADLPKDDVVEFDVMCRISFKGPLSKGVLTANQETEPIVDTTNVVEEDLTYIEPEEEDALDAQDAGEPEDDPVPTPEVEETQGAGAGAA